MEAIRVRDLRVDFDDVCAVRDLTFDIAPGEVFGLIGPNGAGKTTSMRALLGLVEPTYGEIEIGGVDALEHPVEARRLVGFMPDFPPVYDDLRTWEFLDLFACSYGIPPGERRRAVDAVLDRVGLGEKRTAMIPELSRGMRQRLVLAKTLLPEPRVLLLDEPASGLDPHGRADLKEILRALAKEGRTVLVSSHVLAEMSEFCTSVGIMEKGRMIVSGGVAEVTARVMGRGFLQLRVLGPVEPCERLVMEDKRAGAIMVRGDSLEFPFDGDDEAAAELLAALVRGGVRVAAFARKREGLEEVFLKVGARALS